MLGFPAITWCASHNWVSTWDFQQCGMCNQQSLRSACAYAQSDQSLCQSLEYFMIIKLLTEHHLEFLSLTWGCRGSSEPTHVKMPHCWKSHALAQLSLPPKLYNVDLYHLLLHVSCVEFKSFCRMYSHWKCYKISNSFLFLFSNKFYVIR